MTILYIVLVLVAFWLMGGVVAFGFILPFLQKQGAIQDGYYMEYSNKEYWGVAGLCLFGGPILLLGIFLDPTEVGYIPSGFSFRRLTTDELTQYVPEQPHNPQDAETAARIIASGSLRAYPEVVELVRAYIETQKVLDANPLSYSSCRGKGEGWDDLNLQQDAYCAAVNALWAGTDFDHGDDEFTLAVWNWRYWKVMARKCLWYQKQSGNGDKAAETMSRLQDAELELVRVCGLEDIYETTCERLERHFPNLNLKD